MHIQKTPASKQSAFELQGWATTSKVLLKRRLSTSKVWEGSVRKWLRLKWSFGRSLKRGTVYVGVGHATTQKLPSNNPISAHVCSVQTGRHWTLLASIPGRSPSEGLRQIPESRKHWKQSSAWKTNSIVAKWFGQIFVFHFSLAGPEDSFLVLVSCNVSQCWRICFLSGRASSHLVALFGCILNVDLTLLELLSTDSRRSKSLILEAFAVSAYFCMPTHSPNAFALYHPNLLIALVHTKHYWSSVIAFSSMLLDHIAFPNSVAHIKMCPKSKVLCWIVLQSKGWEKSGIDMDLPNSPLLSLKMLRICSRAIRLPRFWVQRKRHRSIQSRKHGNMTHSTLLFCRWFASTFLLESAMKRGACVSWLQKIAIWVFTEKGTG